MSKQKPDSPLWTNVAGPTPELDWLKDVSREEIEATAKQVAEDPEVLAEISRRTEPYRRGAEKHRRMR